MLSNAKTNLLWCVSLGNIVCKLRAGLRSNAENVCWCRPWTSDRCRKRGGGLLSTHSRRRLSFLCWTISFTRTPLPISVKERSLKQRLHTPSYLGHLGVQLASENQFIYCHFNSHSGCPPSKSCLLDKLKLEPHREFLVFLDGYLLWLWWHIDIVGSPFTAEGEKQGFEICNRGTEHAIYFKYHSQNR